MMLVIVLGSTAGHEASAQQQPADASGASDATSGTQTATGQQPVLSEVVVSGVRESIESAQALKRFAPSNIEAVTMEDLGKFTDATVTDAFQRVPGLQVDRNYSGFQQDSVTIRGLGPVFTIMTVNGREVLSYGAADGLTSGCSFSIDAIVPDILGGITIYKAPTADIPDAGVAGEVDFQTIRPLDYKSKDDPNSRYFGTFNARAVYDEEGKRTNPRLSGIAGAHLLDGTLGVYGAFEWDEPTEAMTYTQTAGLALGDLRTTDGTTETTLHNIYLPVGLANNTFHGHKERTTFSGGLQWRPNENWDINADGTYIRYDQVALEDTTYWYAGGPGLDNGTSYSGYGVYSGLFPTGSYTIKNGVLAAYDTSKVINDRNSPSFFTGLTQPQPTIYGQLAHQAFGGLNAAYTNGPWKVIADAGFSTVDSYIPAFGFYGNGYVAAGSENSLGDAPSYTFGPSFLNTSPMVYTSAFINASYSTGERFDTHFDVERALGDDWKLKAGARDQFTRSTYLATPYAILNFQNGWPGSNPSDYGIPDLTPSQVASLNTALNSSGPTSAAAIAGGMPTGNYRAGCAVVPAICALTPTPNSPEFSGPFPSSQVNYGPLTLTGMALSIERIANLYVEAEHKGELFGWDYRANAGVRGAYIGEYAKNFSGKTVLNNPTQQLQVGTTVGYFASDRGHHREALPSFNFTLSPSSDLNLKFGVAKTYTLPDVNAGQSVTLYQNYEGQLGAAFTGNVHLDPITSWNYDFTTEYYTPNGGAIIGSLFYKDVRDFVLNGTTVGTLAGYGSQLFTLSEPLNYTGGKAKGLEFGTNQPFTFLPSPLDGFGAQANYTYVDSSFDKPGFGYYTFPGSSKNNLNAILYWEKYGGSVRLAYSYRSAYLSSHTVFYSFVAAPFTESAKSFLDLSGFYDFNSHFEVNFGISNLTQEKAVRSVFGVPVEVYEIPRIYSLGFRLTL